ncbi:MAG: hypothetical protein HeimC3_19000 [Candidatus Heimdallarchaeota archaeon LC_3]|nr:MAG: hypothetical protein HeimC3_19000 [Candidatus Heimdallarchaeota archaeon LC_3]
MALSDISFVSGLTALLIVFTSIVLGIYLLSSYRKSKSYQTLSLGLTIFSVGWVWSSISMNFLLMIFDMDPLPRIHYVMVFAWAPVVGLIGTTYLVTSLLKPSLVKPLGIIVIVLGAIEIFLMYVLVPFTEIINLQDVIQFASGLPQEELPDASAKGFLQIFSAIAIISMLISGLFFLYTGLKTDISFVKARGIFMGLGFSLFSPLILFDTLLNPDNVVFLLILRLLIITTLFIMAIGITLPGFIFNRFGISKPS